MVPPKKTTSSSKGTIAAKHSVTKKKKCAAPAKNFSVYINLVLKWIHPELSISKRSMQIMNLFIIDIFEKIALDSSLLLCYNNKSTLTSREVQTAVRLLLPGELAMHAVYNGTKAVTFYASG